MALRVSIVTGPRCAGKSTIISCIVKEVCRSQPHYIRLASSDGSKRPPQTGRAHVGDCGVATATWLSYDAVRVFEVLPETLTAIHKRDRKGCVILEADADPALRHAYPYDFGIFVMPAPCSPDEVFRNPKQAHRALQSALHDTAAFSREIHGLSVEHDAGTDDDHEPRKDMTDSQIDRLLQSPLGCELAARIRLQPEYQTLVETDLVVVNTGVGGAGPQVDQVVRELELLVAGFRRQPEARPRIFCCDPCDADDPRRCKLLDHLRTYYGKK